MIRPRFPALLLAALLSLAAGAAHAQRLEVAASDVNLRAAPSLTAQVIRQMQEGEMLDVVRPDSLRDGFFHVRTEQGEEGWVFADLVRRFAGERALAGEEVEPVIAGADAPAARIDSTWFKPPIVQTVFRNTTTGDSCGPFGGGGTSVDSLTNVHKNRGDVPTVYHAVAWEAIGDSVNLPYLRPAPVTRMRWTQENIARIIAPWEGIPVSVVGYIRKISPQGSNRESTNCRLTGEANTDWHLALVKDFDDPESEAIVTEPTPRGKQMANGKWTRARLRNYENPDSPADSVRISGFLLYDPAHPGHLRRFRKTLWEIHPITRIEVWRDGAWRDLEDEP